jgi:hypothetical protein
MKGKLRVPKLTYSNVIASAALFIALGGVAVAAGLPKNSVGPNQLKRGAVNTAKLKNRAVTSAKLANKAVTAGKLGPNSVTPGNIGNGAITSAKIGNGAVIAASIKNGVITTNKLQNNAVNNAKLAPNAVNTGNLLNKSVTVGKLADDVAPLLSTLRSGQTLRGVFYIAGTAAAAADLFSDSVSYPFPLSGSPPAVTVLRKGAPATANCAGVGSGSAPTATAGNLCVYVTGEENLVAGAEGLSAQNNTRLGFGLEAKALAGGKVVVSGQWAVTAP